MSGYDIDAYFVKPWTKNTGEGIALNSNTGTPREAEVMISHAWGEDMEQVVEMLTELTGRPGKPVTKNTVIWFCIFSNYQAGGFDAPYAKHVLGRTGNDLLGPSVTTQVGMDPFEAVIQMPTVKQMISLQVGHSRRRERGRDPTRRTERCRIGWSVPSHCPLTPLHLLPGACRGRWQRLICTSVSGAFWSWTPHSSRGKRWCW